MNAWSKLAGCLVLVALAAGAPAQFAGLSSDDPRTRASAARKLGNSPDGFRQIELLAPLLQDPAEDVRAAVVEALVRMRSIDAQPHLIEATKDLSPRVQSFAVDGLVDFFVPGYLDFGRFASLRVFASNLRARFSKPSPLTVSPYLKINPEVTAAMAEVLRAGRSNEARANAARALGILLARNAGGALEAGVRSSNGMIILESVLAIKKIQDPSLGPSLVFLLRDLDQKVQEAVIRTVGQLRTPEAAPELAEIAQQDGRIGVRRQALIALAKIPGNGQRELFLRFLRDKDAGLRAAAAEGLGRIANAEDLRLLDHHFSLERSASVRLSLAFATVCLGSLVRLNHLIEGLNSRVHRLEARPFLVELARRPEVLERLYVPLETGTVPQRRHLAFVLSESGTAESLPYLRNLAEDRNGEVAAAAIEAMRTLQSRL